ncbi:flavin-containing monooxygenase [Rhizobium giardinii]|uniref:Trimethylamine monooxygenase n=1 Tax=Rhizobium giardinii TaxID=56731 RepID=A0A7W8XD41_9HYPH|nr:NAD(P)-binding domain-containing protein [Rhizobium giardinii]MBB5539568.1 cation diffusion facilitator CzcD-associated flavoprotein CzcO [Rhizobium giardinii]
MSLGTCFKHPEDKIAIIGAGPAGLVAARWILARGLHPVIFEASPRIGGQWNSTSSSSAVWPRMRTNTSRIMTAFSDLPHAAGTGTYVEQSAMLDYLERYAFTMGLLPHLRLKTRVERLERTGDDWLVQSNTEGRSQSDTFARVIVATGRQNQPEVPEIPGLEGFSGSLGVAHTAQYDGAERYRGRSVLVAGCSISALEIAADLALGGAANVVTTNRRQRYILPKMIAGVPTDHVMFNRAAVLLDGVLPPDVIAEAVTAKVLSVAGSPDQFGAPKPAGNAFVAGISQSQNYLPCVAEGRISVMPWIESIDGRSVRFRDGASHMFDAILFGTGFRLSLPWLSENIGRQIGLDGHGADLHDFTFHPELPGLAFLGMFDLVGPTFPVLELQARWVAQCFGGVTPLPSHSEMQAGVERSRATNAGRGSFPMHVAACLFARNAGVEPDAVIWPEIERALLFGPLTPASFRLQGLDALATAPAAVARAAAAFGAITSERFSAEEDGVRTLLKRNTASTTAA